MIHGQIIKTTKFKWRQVCGSVWPAFVNVNNEENCNNTNKNIEELDEKYRFVWII